MDRASVVNRGRRRPRRGEGRLGLLRLAHRHRDRGPADRPPGGDRTAIGIAGSGSVGQALTGARESVSDDAGTIGVAGAVGVLVVLLVAYFCGGYVAGRMARFNGVKQGVAVWVWAIVIAVVVAVVAAVAGRDYDVLGRLNSFPRIPSTRERSARPRSSPWSPRSSSPSPEQFSVDWPACGSTVASTAPASDAESRQDPVPTSPSGPLALRCNESGSVRPPRAADPRRRRREGET